MNPRDEGLLTPVSVGTDVSDAAILRALLAAELGLSRAWLRAGFGNEEAISELVRVCDDDTIIAVNTLAQSAVAGGNPVIPLVKLLRSHVSTSSAEWVHHGVTSQDILDTALMIVSAQSRTQLLHNLRAAIGALQTLSQQHRDEPTAARTLTQHAVPTTMGARIATWIRGLERAVVKLDALELPAQLGGAGGTLAAIVEQADTPTASSLPTLFAAEVGLDAPAAPWHVTRWPITELGDALVQTVDAASKIASDVATLSRTEIGELADPGAGSSSAMPQKQNPTAAILIRSAGVRAPHLGATLHTAAAFAVDERPDGAWHAEWPTLRELLSITLGATAQLAGLCARLRVDSAAVARNIAATDGLLVAERLMIRLAPRIGAQRVNELINEATATGRLAELLQSLPELEGVDIDELIDPSNYLGLATELADAATEETDA